MKFNHISNYNHKADYVTEVLDPVSMTVPDDCLSLHDILYRYSQGVPVSLSENDDYDDDPDFDNCRIRGDYDLVDAQTEQLALESKREQILKDAQNSRVKKADVEQSKSSEAKTEVVNTEADVMESTS